MLNFTAIDVETANADCASICQIGVIHVRSGKVAEEWDRLVNPEDWFDLFNVSIHGIVRGRVERSPTLPQVYHELCSQVDNAVLVSHTAFDRVAIGRACERYSLRQLPVTWLDSARVARRAWPETYGRAGYGLKNLANDFGISFTHHDALEDARVAAEILLRSCAHTGTDVEEWLRRVNEPVFPEQVSVKSLGDPGGPLSGETVVFTGSLAIPRRKAADMAAAAGCNVAKGVNRQVTMLVVGVQDREKLKGYQKSSKHRMAESLIEKGFDIRILSEKDFADLVGL